MKKIAALMAIFAISLFLLGPIGGALAQVPLSIWVDSELDEVDLVPGDGICETETGSCTLRAAIQEANALVGQNSIILPAGHYVLSLAGEEKEVAAHIGDLDITDELIIEGHDDMDTIIDANGLDRIFHIHPNGGLVLGSLTITHGMTAREEPNGGGILNEANLILADVVLEDNEALERGGGVFNAGSLEITNSELRWNGAEVGGGLYNSGQVLIEDRSSIEGNIAAMGAGIFNDKEGRIEILYADIDRNEATTDEASGGGIYNLGIIAIEGGYIVDNTADMRGGGIFNLHEMELEGVLVDGNTALFGGGVINAGQMTLVDCLFESNQAWWAGGGILNSGYFNEQDIENRLEIKQTRVDRNTAPIGAGIYNEEQGIVSIVDSMLSLNIAEQAGGAVSNFLGDVSLIRSTLTKNAAEIGGAVSNFVEEPLQNPQPMPSHPASVFMPTTGWESDRALDYPDPAVDKSNISLFNSTISGNSASLLGGGLHNEGQLTLVSSTILQNEVLTPVPTVAGPGGDLYSAEDGVTDVGSTIIGRCAGEGKVVSSGHNLTISETCGLEEESDILDAQFTIQPLNNYGGLTLTHALYPDSAAIDAGDRALCGDTDQRGFSRLEDGDGDGFAICDIGSFELEGYPPTFEDVPFDHWAHDVIEILYLKGYTAGCQLDPLRFCPEYTMIRAESAVFVERGVHGAEFEPTPPATPSFEDVPADYWAAGWIENLWLDGYTAGCGTDPLTYCPLWEHTRAEGCVFYLRMMNGVDYEPPEARGLFVDVPTEWWGAGWVEAAYEAGLIEACETDPEMRFCPNDPLDRALAAYMMVQAKDLPVP